MESTYVLGLQVEAIIELLEVSLRTTYFQVDSKFFQQKDGKAMGSSLSPIVSNTYIQHFEELAFDSAQHKNHCCGSSMLMTHLWSGLMAQRSYRISLATSIV
jgi:hypothetical protein